MIRMDNPLFLGAPREVAALTTQHVHADAI